VILVIIVITIYMKAVERLKNRLIEELGDRIDSIVLYGSVARKTAHKESDIDLLIVIREDDRSIYEKISKIRTHVDLENNTVTSIVHFTAEELERCAGLHSPFIEGVLKEGVILYDRGAFKKLRDRSSYMYLNLLKTSPYPD